VEMYPFTMDVDMTFMLKLNDFIIIDHIHEITAVYRDGNNCQGNSGITGMVVTLKTQSEYVSTLHHIL